MATRPALLLLLLLLKGRVSRAWCGVCRQAAAAKHRACVARARLTI